MSVHWSAQAAQARLRCLPAHRHAQPAAPAAPAGPTAGPTAAPSRTPCHVHVQLIGAGRVLAGQAAVIAAGRSARFSLTLTRAGARTLSGAGSLTVVLQATLGHGGTPVTSRGRLTAPGPTGAEVVSYAERFVGRPYVYGADGPASFDCSGFTSYVYGHFGIQLARSSYQQMSQGKPVHGPLQLGDLVLWEGGGHVGIYTGGHTFISATVHKGIWIYSFVTWSQTQPWTTARRLLPGA